MPSYDTWEGLCHAAQTKCSQILQKDAAPVATDIVKKHIKTDVYDAYTPRKNGWVGKTTYRRRHVMEGSLYTSVIAANEILITSRVNGNTSIVPGWNFTVSEPGDFFRFLEKGKTGIWKNGFPRPVITNAQKEINKSAEIKTAIKAGIKREFEV